MRCAGLFPKKTDPERHPRVCGNNAAYAAISGMRKTYRKPNGFSSARQLPVPAALHAYFPTLQRLSKNRRCLLKSIIHPFGVFFKKNIDNEKRHNVKFIMRIILIYFLIRKQQKK